MLNRSSLPPQGPPVANKLAAALAMHRQGQLDGAEAIYAEILQSQPQHFDALQLLAKIAAHRNNHEVAVELYDRALEVRQDNVDALVNRGAALSCLHRHLEALESYDGALAIAPDTVVALNNRGNALRELNRPEEALESYDRALVVAPDHLEAMNNRGNALRDLNRSEEALEIYDRALRFAPDSLAVLNNRGNALSDLKRFEEALESYDLALGILPDHAGLLNRRGIALQDLKRPEEALRSFERAISLDSDSAEAHFNRGTALSAMNRLQEAVASFERAIELDADYPEAFLERGNALREMTRIDEALESLERAISLRPDYAEAWVNKALLLILCGDYDQGWALHEWRWKREDYRQALQDFKEPLWLGDGDLAGKTILLHAEQGLGDAIQFCRYALLAEAHGANVIVAVATTLVELVRTMSPRIAVVDGGTVLPAFDFHCPMMSLPFAFKTNLDTIPASTEYLRTDPQKSRYWKEKLGEKRKPRVGLVWAGGLMPDHPHQWEVNERRNIDLSKLAQLKDERIEFYSLQKGEPAESDLAKLKAAHWDGPEIIDHTSELADFSDTAALIDNLDLVISVDTSTAHLAGGLGKPTWILNRFDTCYRWLLDREDSPWYASVRLFRQTTPGDWRDPVARIAQELKRL